ncbi:MAG TPA: metallophosphoesterase N-terminal domain-containing protein, partial [Pseudoxanthomonas sp.]|nr:metallophosphoesterase N-terminal domain-containing protein [Pseudoxanthomonas sp.]
MRCALFLLLVSGAITTVHAQEPACNAGRVWADANGNGMVDQGEKGVAGVKVSDGKRIVSTDAQGSYVLPLHEGHGQTLFVIKPAGYDFPTRDDGLP